MVGRPRTVKSGERTRVVIVVGERSMAPNAKGLIAALENFQIHAMSKKESEELHELLEWTRITIEEKWMEWDR